MQFLPSIEGSRQTTRTDVYELSIRVDDFERNLTARIDRFEQSFTARSDAVNQRLDRILPTLAAGLIAIIATIVSQNFI